LPSFLKDPLALVHHHKEREFEWPVRRELPPTWKFHFEIFADPAQQQILFDIVFKVPTYERRFYALGEDPWVETVVGKQLGNRAAHSSHLIGREDWFSTTGRTFKMLLGDLRPHLYDLDPRVGQNVRMFNPNPVFDPPGGVAESVSCSLCQDIFELGTAMWAGGYLGWVHFGCYKEA